MDLYEYVADRPTFATDPTGLKKCCVEKFDVPANRKVTFDDGVRIAFVLPAALPQAPLPFVPVYGFIGQSLFEYFEMNATFIEDKDKDCCCACCEYRQYVKGEFKLGGVVQDHMLPGGKLKKAAFQEDGVPAPTGLPGYAAGQPAFYGHRADAGFANDVYDTPNRATGCKYKGKDAPGIRGYRGPAAKFEAHLEFRGQIIDTCNKNAVRKTADWKVDLDRELNKAAAK